MIRLRLLGETAIDVDETPVGPDSQVLFAVLLVLALERGKRLARTALHRLLWPAADDETGRHNLRQVLYKLRQLGVPVDATQSSVMLDAGQVVGELLELTSGDASIGARIASGRRVGDLMPGYAPAFSSPFADWIDEQRALLQTQLRRSLLAALADARAGGRWREVEALAREVLRFDPLNEEATLTLAEATALAGAKAQAIGIIDRYLQELGGGPADLKLPATVLRRRIAERFPTHKYVNAADACFVGRAREMAELLAVWRRAKDRRGGAVLLWGEPGIGKTRLAQELGRVAVLQGAQVQRVASRSWDLQRPLGAIVDLVPPLRELPGAAGIDPRCNEYLDRLTKHDPTRPLTDLPDPATLHRQVRQAVFDLIDALLAEAPLVLVFEDVQWLDAASWEVLAELLRLARTRRLLLVLTSRVIAPPQMPENEDWQTLLRLRLDGIDEAATNELLDAITREAGRYVDPEYRDWCVPLANGNPLHVQEIALQWLEKGSAKEAPRTLMSLLEARVSRLQPGALLLLQALALLGFAAYAELMSLTFDASLASMSAALTELERERMIISRDGKVAPRHSAIADAALGMLQSSARAVLHGALARALGRASTALRSPHWQWHCYRHFLHAGNESEAHTALTLFVRAQLEIGHAEAGLAALTATLDEFRSMSSRESLTNELELAYSRIGMWRELHSVHEHHPEHGDLTASSADHPIRRLETSWRVGGAIRELHHRAIALAHSAQLPAEERLKAAFWAMVFASNLNDRASIEAISRFVSGQSPLLKQSVDALLCKLIAASEFCAADEVSALVRVLQSHAPRIPDPIERCRILRLGGQALTRIGELEWACDLHHAAMAIAEEAGAQGARAQGMLQLAGIALQQHDLDAARHWTDAAAETFPAGHNEIQDLGLQYLRFQLAAIDDDWSSAVLCAKRLGSPDPADSNVQQQAARLSVALRLATISGASSVNLEQRLHACLDFLSNHRGLANLDLMASAMVRAFLLLGRATDANDSLDAFLKRHRSDLGPVHLDLHNARSLLGSCVAEGADLTKNDCSAAVRSAQRN